MAKRVKPHRRIGIRESEAWYEGARSKYENFARIVAGILAGLLEENKIDHLSITSRVKTQESFAEKLRRKRYHDASRDVHDLAGVRIITYIESDVERVAKLIRRTLHVHSDKSLDKADELGTDKTGYRSVHLVSDLGKERASLPEYRPYEGLVIEIQVRTVLQHAWAEIEHDRGYKFSGVLPAALQRRLNIAAGALELVDREFDAISKEIDAYGKHVIDATKSGNLSIAITSQSVSEYLERKFDNAPGFHVGSFMEREWIEELHDFGLKTIHDIDSILTPDFLAESEKDYQTGIGILRSAMMYADLERYFKEAWNNHWGGISPSTVSFLSKVHGAENVQKILSSCDIEILPDDFELFE